jgi:secreted trypsin-like serine protease
MRRVRTLAAATCGAAALLLTGPTPAFAVANGTAAKSGQFPYAVKLVMTDIPSSSGGLYDSACSGALIAGGWVITAGHCFHDTAGNPVDGQVPYTTTATFNTVTTNPAESSAVTAKVLVVRQDPNADIALAQLDSQTTTVTPLALASTAPAAGDKLTVAGWGATSSTGSPSNQLYSGEMKVSGVASTTVTVSDSGRNPVTPCPYDSGAPFIRNPTGSNPVLVSTESNGRDCPHSGPETTARVDTQRTWITSVINGASTQA